MTLEIIDTPDYGVAHPDDAEDSRATENLWEEYQLSHPKGVARK